MNIFGTFIKNPKNTKFDGEDDDEYILYIFRRSIITTLDWIVVGGLMVLLPSFALQFIDFLAKNSFFALSDELVTILGLFWYLVTLGFLFQNFLNWFFNVYIITNKRIVDMDFHGILYRNISEAPLKNVEDVTSNISGALEVIFNYGNVYVQTSAEQREFEFGNVNNPAKIRDIISDLVTEVNNGHRS